MTFSALGLHFAQRVAFLLLLGVQPGYAARVQVAIDPASTQIAYTVFALGFFPVQARFAQFTGTLAADPADPAACDVHVVVQVASLQMADAARTAQALGPAMLDATRFPAIRFDGRCSDGGVSGTLTLHGISRMLHFSKQRKGPSIITTATLQREDFGVSGMAYLVGDRVQLCLTTQLPGVFATAR